MPALLAYFDTSVLVRRYVEEAGATRARNLLGTHRLLSSAVAPLEVLAALCRKRASGQLPTTDFTAIRSRVLRDRTHWELIEVSPLVLAQAEAVIMETALRTIDALHLASHLVFQSSSGLRIPFVTGDARQRDAATQLELDVVWAG